MALALNAASRKGRYDVVIVGSGFAGMAAAIALVREGARTAVVEARADVGISVPGWAETVQPTCRRLLSRLGMGEWAEHVARPSNGMCSSWGSEDLFVKSSLSSPFGHGLRIDRNAFLQYIMGYMRLIGISPIMGVRVRDDGRNRLLVAKDGQGQQLRGDFFIDASGRRRVLARSRTGILRYDRLMAAAIAVPEPDRSRDRRDILSLSLVEAVESGWWYSAVTPSRRRLFVRFADAGSSAITKWRSREDLIDDMLSTKHVAAVARNCDFSAATGIAFASASSTRLRAACGSGWAAIGDAARTVDPLSSHGIHNAINDGIRIAHAAIERAAGRIGALADYQRAHEQDYEAYLSTKERVYAAEQRWAEHPFWALRYP